MTKASNRGHGSPFDRGAADSYYRREYDPHYWPEGTYKGDRVDNCDMTKEQKAEYFAGHRYNESLGHFKDWG